ncbi:prephenate dehydratase [Trueperella pecoris]|nr:prephenate dehydratase [Trueperella pecoris]
MMRYSFLGPRGTFTQQALNQICPEEESTHIPALDSPRAIKMVRAGQADFAVVPIENSVEGGINATLDTLAAGSDLLIYGEVLVDIAFTLAVRPGTKLEDITHISTHQAAWTQCRNWLGVHLPDVVHLPATSTAAGAAGLAADGEPGYQATLVSALAAQQYGLEALREGVADNPDAVTRFVLIGKAGKLPPRTGSDKTTLMVQLPSDEAGALLNMLEQFKARGVNLSRIESRPIGDSLGRYAFSIDAEGHLMDERIQSVLIGLHRVCPKVTFLGSYPSADGRRIHPRPGTSDDDFLGARAWVDSLVERSR